MPHDKITNVRVRSFDELPEPHLIREELPHSDSSAETVVIGRKAVADAIHGDDDRMLVIVGPCSIHDPEAAFDYASRLKELADEVSKELIVLMRVYFEKPRTTIGWKGLINDPNLNDTRDIQLGIRKAREVLLRITSLGMPCGTEFLDPIVPQYISDLVSWVAVGARTTESQTHREMASGLSMPVGFKNATDGGVQVAIDAMVSSRSPHDFLGVSLQGRVSVVRTTGNTDVHLVLRGGLAGSNYSKADLAYARAKIEEIGMVGRRLLVDCSHGNSNKDYRRQGEVFRHVVEGIASKEPSLLGVMLESNLCEGSQSFGAKPLTRGVSITDACVGWEETRRLLLEASARCKSS